MKANELIDGGLYKVDNEIVFFYALNGCLYKKSGDSIVCFGRIFKGAESDELEVQTQNLEWGKLSPIPLTDEILEKNGLSECTEFYDGWNFEFSNNKRRVICGGPIWYVHELQNALLLCGLKDLANNFKI